MKKKLLALLLTVTAVTALLTSCLIPTPDNGDDPPSGDVAEYTCFVKSASDGNDYTELLAQINEALGYSLMTYTDSGSAAKGEVVFGEADRAITDAAESALQTKLSDVDLENERDTAVGYVIYAEGGSLAVYWNHDYAEAAATAALVSILKEGVAPDAAGVLNHDAYSLIVRANADKVISDAQKWAAIEATSPETAAALREALEFYEIEKIYEYYGELYDPITGAFYYAKSSRDYDTFLPDIESTSQILRGIRENGFLTGYADPIAAYPKEMQEKFISFAQSLQDKDDGYFYHPQWGKDLKTARLGRDQTNALVVLKMFGAKPLYPTGNDRLEDNFDEDDFEVSYRSDVSLTSPLGGSAVVAVSKVVGVAESDSRFESLETFMAWVEDLVANRTSHSFGHTMSSSGGQINAAGYMDELLDYLDAMQTEIFDRQMAAHEADPVNNPEPSGLWEEGKDYVSLSGCFKIVGMYNSYKREIKREYIPYMVKAAVEAINIPVEEHYKDYPLKQMVYIYNPWAGLGRVFLNMNRYNADLYEEMIAITRVNAPDMIFNTIRKLNLFRRSDGSFSYYVTGAAPTTQGVPVCLGFPDEGDVNATGLAFGMYRDMFETLGYEYVEPYNNEDFDSFIEICQSMLPAEKILLTSSDPYEFNTIPNAMYSKVVNGTVEIVTDPVSGIGDVLEFNTAYGDGEQIRMDVHGNYINNNCYIFESDLCVLSSDGYATPFSIRFGDFKDSKTSALSYRMDVTVSGDTVSLVDISADSKGNKTNYGAVASIGEWFKLRIEYYVTEEGPRIKVFVNDKYVGFSQNFFGSEQENAVPANVYKQLQIWAFKNTTSTLLVDNLLSVCETKTYEEQLVINSYDFTDGRLTLAPTGANMGAAIITDPSNSENKVLSTYAKDKSQTAVGYLTIPLAPKSPVASLTTVGFDLCIGSVDYDGDGYYNEVVGDMFSESGHPMVFKYGIYTGDMEILRLVAKAEQSGSVSSGWSLWLHSADDTVIAEVASGLEYGVSYSISVAFEIGEDEELVTITLDGDEVLQGGYVLSTEGISNFVPEGSVSIKLQHLKRFIGEIYHDNIFVEFED